MTEARRNSNREYYNANKQSISLARREYHKANKKALLSANQKYRKQNRHRLNEYQKSYVKMNHYKIKCMDLVRNAVSVGYLTRSPYCEICNKPTKTDGHHQDYLKPLSVNWLCKSCHILVHYCIKDLQKLVFADIANVSKKWREREKKCLSFQINSSLSGGKVSSPSRIPACGDNTGI